MQRERWHQIRSNIENATRHGACDRCDVFCPMDGATAAGGKRGPSCRKQDVVGARTRCGARRISRFSFDIGRDTALPVRRRHQAAEWGSRRPEDCSGACGTSCARGTCGSSGARLPVRHEVARGAGLADGIGGVRKPDRPSVTTCVRRPVSTERGDVALGAGRPNRARVPV